MSDATGLVTAYEYYGVTEANAGKVKCQTVGGKKTWYAYTPRGELWRTWGDVPYPGEYHYNDYGDLTNLVTFRGGGGWASSIWPENQTGDNTYWTYDDYSGSLLKKTDAQGNGVTYTYDPDTGRLLTRSWARTSGIANGDPVTLTQSYNEYGDLAGLDYNEGTPSVRFNNYSRAGLPREIVDGSGVSALVYDPAGRLVSVAGESGFYAGVGLTNHFGAQGRVSLEIQQSLQPVLHQDFGYDAYGRLSSAAQSSAALAISATYGYAPDSDLLQTTTYYNGSTVAMSATRAWDYGLRLRRITSIAGTTTTSDHSYLYDGQNRRKQDTTEDGSVWKYGYNDRNELTSAAKSWPDAKPVAGEQFGYCYDNIGNRASASEGGDANGLNLRSESYGVNSLNQYTSRTRPSPDKVDVMGSAFSTATLTVNGNATVRKGEPYDCALLVDNASGPVWQGVTNLAVLGAERATNTGHLLIVPRQQTFAYDLDGNLTFDGVWIYDWDAENRLKSMTMTNIANLPEAQRQRLDFAYDYLGRRAQKIVSTNSGTAWVGQSTNRYVYDLGGWNLLAIVDPQSSILSSYVWGQDLSGTMAGAGGIGGLLAACEYGGGSMTNADFAAFDGNGNLTALVRASDRTIVGRYEYSAFGQTLRQTGPMAKANPFRFSTKFVDDESGLVYYGFRYYSPALGRWINRDPAEEKGSLNLCCFIRNRGPNTYDTDGRMEAVEVTTAGGTSAWISSRIGGAVFGAVCALSEDLLRSENGEGLNWNQVNWDKVRTDVEKGALYGAVSGGLGGKTVGDMLLNNATAGMLTGLVGGFIYGLMEDE